MYGTDEEEYYAKLLKTHKKLKTLPLPRTPNRAKLYFVCAYGHENAPSAHSVFEYSKRQFKDVKPGDYPATLAAKGLYGEVGDPIGQGLDSIIERTMRDHHFIVSAHARVTRDLLKEHPELEHRIIDLYELTGISDIPSQFGESQSRKLIDEVNMRVRAEKRLRRQLRRTEKAKNKVKLEIPGKSARVLFFFSPNPGEAEALHRSFPRVFRHSSEHPYITTVFEAPPTGSKLSEPVHRSTFHGKQRVLRPDFIITPSGVAMARFLEMFPQFSDRCIDASDYSRAREDYKLPNTGEWRTLLNHLEGRLEGERRGRRKQRTPKRKQKTTGRKQKTTIRSRRTTGRGRKTTGRKQKTTKR